MAIPVSRNTLGMDREVTREVASNRARTSLIRKGMRQAKKEKNYEKALGFANLLDAEGRPYGTTGSAEDVNAIAQGRVASREALSNQMRSQMGALTGRTREGNIAAAKAAGTFDATRAKFNEDNKGKKVMDDMGNIADAPATPPAGTTTTPAAGDKPADKPAETTPAFQTKPAAGTTPYSPKPEVTVVPAGDGTAPSAGTPSPAAPQKPAGKVKSSRQKLIEALVAGRVVDPELQKRLVKEEATAAESNATPKQASASQQVANSAPTVSPSVAPTKQAAPKPAAKAATEAKAPPAAATTPPAVKGPATPRPVDSLLTEKRGFGAADKTNPANWEYKVNPSASELPYIAGRGSDAAARALQVANPFTMFQTLKQGGKSALPPMMGAQPEYANASERLKGDADVIKAASAAGYIKARRGQDQYGNNKLEVLTPVMRETGEAVRPWLKKAAVAARERGGPVKAGKPYLVGEKGPEIIVPEEDGEVIPNKDLKKKKARKHLQTALLKK